MAEGDKQKLTTMEDHLAKHLKLAQKLEAARDKSTSSAITSIRSGFMSDGKARARKNSDFIRAGFRQEMAKILGR